MATTTTSSSGSGGTGSSGNGSSSNTSSDPINTEIIPSNTSTALVGDKYTSSPSFEHQGQEKEEEEVEEEVEEEEEEDGGSGVGEVDGGEEQRSGQDLCDLNAMMETMRVKLHIHQMSDWYNVPLILLRETEAKYLGVF